MAWLNLVRWKNLLIIFLTQLLAWWCVILRTEPRVLNTFNFLLLALSTILIAAAGYIINDYFDIKIDLVNKPKKVVLDRIIPRKQAIVSHAALNFIALALAAYVAIRGHHYEWALLQAFCVLLLWFYSTHLKRRYISGNIAIALLSSLTVISLIIYEPALRPAGARYIFSLPGWVLVVYACFAFMLTWMREIVKDMEDCIGDETGGCVTMPVKKGISFSARVVMLLSVFVFLPLLSSAFILYNYGYTLLSAYVTLIILSLAAWCVYLFKNSTPQHYHNSSQGLKIIMLLGVCSLVIYYFQSTE